MISLDKSLFVWTLHWKKSELRSGCVNDATLTVMRTLSNAFLFMNSVKYIFFLPYSLFDTHIS